MDVLINVLISILIIAALVIIILRINIPGFHRCMDVVEEKKRKTGELAFLSFLGAYIYGISGLFFVMLIVFVIMYAAVLIF